MFKGLLVFSFFVLLSMQAFTQPVQYRIQQISNIPKAQQAQLLYQNLVRTHPTFKDINFEVLQKGLKEVPIKIDPLNVFLWQEDAKPYESITAEEAEKLAVGLLNNANLERLSLLLEIRNLRYKKYLIESPQYLQNPVFRQNFTDYLVDKAGLKNFLEKKHSFRGKSLTPEEVARELEKDFPANEEEFLEELAICMALLVHPYTDIIPISHIERLYEVANYVFKEKADDYIEDISDEDLLFATIMNAIMMSADTHSQFLTPMESKALSDNFKIFTPIGVEFAAYPQNPMILFVTPDSPAEAAGVKAGDIILEIDSKKTDGLDNLETYFLFGTIDSKDVVNVKVSRNGKKLNFAINRNNWKKTIANKINVTTKIVNGKKLVILNLSIFGDDFGNKVIAELKKLGNNIDGVVIDLRYNRGGKLDEVTKIVQVFQSPEQKLVWIASNTKTKYLDSNLSMPEEKDLYNLGNIPVVVLVNSASASASEILSGSLKANGRALVLGSEHTSGKASIQGIQEDITFEMVNKQDADYKQFKIDGVFKSTVALYYLPDGSSPQYTGVTSDITIKGSYQDEENLEKKLINPIPPQSLDASLYANYTEQFKPQKIISKTVLKEASLKRQASWNEKDLSEDKITEEALAILTDWIDLGGQ